MSAEAIRDLLKQTTAPMKPVKRKELLGGRHPTLDSLEWEEERELEEA